MNTIWWKLFQKKVQRIRVRVQHKLNVLSSLPWCSKDSRVPASCIQPLCKPYTVGFVPAFKMRLRRGLGTPTQITVPFVFTVCNPTLQKKLVEFETCMKESPQ